MTDATIIGNVGTVDDLKFTQSGKAVLGFSIAENHMRKNRADEWETVSTSWWRTSIWDKQAETLSEHLRKGDRVIAVGQLKQRTFETQTGEKRTVTELSARNVGIIPKAQQGSFQPQPQADPWTPQAPLPDEAPF